MKTKSLASTRSHGFTLVEVTMAIGIAAVSLLGVVALLPMGIASNRDSVNMTHAASVAEALVMDLRGTAESGTSKLYGLTLEPNATPSLVYCKTDGTKVNEAMEADYRAAVTVVPATSLHTPTTVRVVVAWPATEYPVNSFEALTALERN